VRSRLVCAEILPDVYLSYDAFVAYQVAGANRRWRWQLFREGFRYVTSLVGGGSAFVVRAASSFIFYEDIETYRLAGNFVGCWFGLWLTIPAPPAPQARIRVERDTVQISVHIQLPVTITILSHKTGRQRLGSIKVDVRDFHLPLNSGWGRKYD